MRPAFKRCLLYCLVIPALALPVAAWPQAAAQPQQGNAPQQMAPQQMAQIRAERLMDMEVENRQGEPLGEIEDLVIDLDTGRVQFAVLEVENPGPNTLLAYPLSDFAPGNGNKLVLDIPREKLKQQKGFARNAWPAWRDPFWGDTQGKRLVRAAALVDRNIRDRNGNPVGKLDDLIVDLPSAAVTDAVIDIRHSRREARVPMSALSIDSKTGQPVLNMDPVQLAELSATQMRASRLMDMEVENRKGQPIGEIEDLVIDLDSGRVQFAVLELENVFDVGRKLFAYRLSDFRPGGRKLVLDVEPEQLKQAKGFNADNWPPWRDPYWTAYTPPPGGRAASGMSGQGADASASAGASAQPARLVRAVELMGKEVRHRNGEEAGEVRDLIIDMRSSAVTHALIDIARSPEEARVPFSALSMDSGSGALWLSMDRTQLLMSPP